jgi:hypothetical protein
MSANRRPESNAELRCVKGRDGSFGKYRNPLQYPLVVRG